MLHRRDAMIRLGQLGLGAVTLPGFLEAQRARGGNGRAKSCIYVFLWGGPPQQDMWDLKPAAPSGIRSEFAPIRTAVPGIELCEHLPLLARHTDKVALVRSLSHASNNHEPSVYHMLTGKQNPTLAVPRNQRRRSDFPNIGSVVSAFTPPGALPASVTVPRPIGHSGVTYAGTYAGFLGPRHDPLELKEAPNAPVPAAHPVALPPDVDATRLQGRLGLARLLEEQDRRMQESRSTQDLGSFYEQAFRMITAPAARRAFDLDLEPPAVRDRYGRNEYGESFLLARRLIEAGVRFVSVVWLYVTEKNVVSNVWDTHGGVGALGGISGFAMLTEKYCLPPLDRATAALLEDLHDRGMLDETLVVMAGEFGRTPNLNRNQGREHWGAAQTALLAGGGIRGGQVYGATDGHAAYVKDSPVAPEDLLATMYHALGLPPDAEIHDRENRPYRICDGRPIHALFG
jgi:hypothetical protein